ncbi:MAG TPA: TlpA disulfide reductase family protein [Pyrinomonadaceae bacterium]|jgi:thiol-disulfide isomerase/thioredoxin|nr:TlpA disulfide reductase family protein [Pyrinomonadaceae bacterium]
MRLVRIATAFSFCLLFASFASFAAPAQKQKGRAAKPPTKSQKPIVVAPIDTAALKNILSEQRERPLLINFWATWCDPCRDEFPDLVKIDSEYRPQSMDFITVSLDDFSDIKTSVPQFLGTMKANMPAYLLNVPDPEPAIDLVDPGWSGSLPATFLFNAKGEVVYKHFGRVDPNELRAAIDKLVKKTDE